MHPRLRNPRRRQPDGAHQTSTYYSHAKGRSAVSVSIKPLEDRIVVKALEAETTTASGLVI
ncbi:MAG: hypothetical protein L6311_06825, partial [Cellulomonas sp.]|nr:hypothetical protein [Cellulomonas sp.]